MKKLIATLSAAGIIISITAFTLNGDGNNQINKETAYEMEVVTTNLATDRIEADFR
ncbi:hypothetical protein OO013_01310 [Mangrovivirga sp. M17]|uniref:Uncharacterized protein n=1 Tax=Mangrovivirga halotolerans TaxID=2993936 RepID=A0ABT3RM71_9BACT|nr:hypothetical protein [Mangrovivirga halotolerans]MCX2742479.1 hypothetical protein [Mangrovivirga halotolerans]